MAKHVRTGEPWQSQRAKRLTRSNGAEVLSGYPGDLSEADEDFTGEDGTVQPVEEPPVDFSEVK